MGNCVAISTSKSVTTEARPGLNEQPFNSVGDDNENGRYGQKRRGRKGSRSSKIKEAEGFSSSKPPVSCKNAGEGVMRVKLVIRKHELLELLSNRVDKKVAMRDLLVELQPKLGDQSTAVYDPYGENFGTAARMNSHSVWRPSLRSIPEDNNPNNY